MIQLDNLQQFIQNYIGDVRINSFAMHITAEPQKITHYGLSFVYTILNTLESHYLISLWGIPPCIMSDAIEHIHYSEKTFFHGYDTFCAICFCKHWCPGWDSRLNPLKNLRRKVLAHPKEIVIEITNHCNFKCVTCTSSKKNTSHINLDTINTLLQQAKDHEIKAVRFTGGEPLLHPELQTILHKAKQHDFYVVLNTNASLINKQIFPLLHDTVDNILISLQGYSPSSDARLTGVTSNFTQKIKTINALRKKINIVRIGTIIHPNLTKYFHHYSALLQYAGITLWELYRPMPINALLPACNPQILCALMRHIQTLKQTGTHARIANPVPFCITTDQQLAQDTLLGAYASEGHTRIVWDIDGYFKPSYFINENLGTTITEAWQHPLLQKIRSLSYVPRHCTTCSFLHWCKGGSRVWSKATTQSYFKPDPLIPEVK